jgi:hypothetical protein
MSKKTWTFTMEDDGNKTRLQRVNDGFTPFELLGLCAMIQHDVLDQMRGVVRPDVVTREVVVEKEGSEGKQ